MLDLPNVKENHIKSPSIVTLYNITNIRRATQANNKY